MYDYFEGLGFLSASLLLIVPLIIGIFYLLSLYKAMEAVPENKRLFPSWMVWLMIIPFVGFIFGWIMEPFGIPKSFAAAAENNQAMKDASNTIFGLGLTHMILLTIWFIPVIGWIAVLVSVIIWIIYWVKVVNFKNTYLLNPLTNIKEIKNNL